jgi:hypothetical protein
MVYEQVVLLQKLFYITIERQDNATPNPFDIKDYLGNSGARIPELVNYLETSIIIIRFFYQQYKYISK